jgi:hypothetical protein
MINEDAEKPEKGRIPVLFEIIEKELAAPERKALGSPLVRTAGK